MSSPVLGLGESACSDSTLVGGKAANLSRRAATHRVPPGFCLPAHGQVRDADIDAAYHEFSVASGVADPAVAVRSSALDEDGAAASFAGQHETFLNVRGLTELHAAIQRCQESVRAPRALAYRRERGLTASDARMAVLVQQLVFAEASGVLFSANPMTGARGEAVVTISWGLGESVVGGTVSPDTYVVRKADLSIVARQIGAKFRMTVTVQGGTREIDVPEQDRNRPSVSDAQCIDAVRMAIALEDEMGWPVDVECAWQDGICYLLQCRPITTLPNANGKH
jgi:phosphoenolpyruvate synthase/pyruvate phosphate dikinase